MKTKQLTIENGKSKITLPVEVRVLQVQYQDKDGKSHSLPFKVVKERLEVREEFSGIVTITWERLPTRPLYAASYYPMT